MGEDIVSPVKRRLREKLRNQPNPDESKPQKRAKTQHDETAKPSKQTQNPDAPSTAGDAGPAKDDASPSHHDAEIAINRAPVATLWAAVVACRQGADWDTALTVGKAVAGLFAQAKGRRLGVMHEKEDHDDKGKRKAEQPKLHYFGMHLKAAEASGGELHAVDGNGKPISAASVQRYLDKAFGESLQPFKDAMMALARRYDNDELHHSAYHLYEQFRPEVSGGKSGWGQKGKLQMSTLQRLTDAAQHA